MHGFTPPVIYISGTPAVVSFGPLPVGSFVRSISLLNGSFAADTSFGVFVSSVPLTAGNYATSGRPLLRPLGTFGGPLAGLPSSFEGEFRIPLNLLVVDNVSYISFAYEGGVNAINAVVTIDVEVPRPEVIPPVPALSES